MPRYQDISHFRAPYKDSYLSGLGAAPGARPRRALRGFGAVTAFAPEFFSVAGTPVKRVPRTKGTKGEPSAFDLYVKTLKGMFVDGDAKGQPDKTDGMKLLSVSGTLITAADAAAAKKAGKKNVVPALDYLNAGTKAGLYALGPVSFDPAVSGSFIYLVSASELPAAAGGTSPNEIISTPGEKLGGLSVAAMAGYGAVGLLVVAALATVAKKRR